MSAYFKRHKTKYDGVHFIMSSKAYRGEPEKIFYYRVKEKGLDKNGEVVWKTKDYPVGRQSKGVTARKAHFKRVDHLKSGGKDEALYKQLTFNQIWVKYLSVRRDGGGKKADESNYKNYIKAKFGEREPHKTNPLQYERLRVSMDKKGKSPQTVKHVLALIRRLINFAVDKRLIAPLPFKIKVPKLRKKPPVLLSDEQLKNLQKVLDSYPDRSGAGIMQMELFTGMRRSEVFKLKWEDIDFDNGSIHVREPKGGDDQLYPINFKVAKILAEQQVKSEYIFPGKDGRMRRCNRRVANYIKEKAGLPKDFRPNHGLRHMFASSAIWAGANLQAVQFLLGHKDQRTTQGYTHTRNELLREVSNKAARYILRKKNAK